MGRFLKLIVLWGLVLAALTPAETLSAQLASADQNIFLDLLPGLKTAPAPAWLQPGTRVTYFSAAASIAAERTKLTEDPTGDWEVTYPDGSKKRYREEDISGTGRRGTTRKPRESYTGLPQRQRQPSWSLRRAPRGRPRSGSPQR